MENEADKLNGIMAHSTASPDSLKQPVNTALFTYCNQVINQEWRMKKNGDVTQPSAIPNLRLMLLKTAPQGKVQESIFAVIDNDLNSISDFRRNTLRHNKSLVPHMVWLLLKTGSVMLVVFSYLFNVPSAKLKKCTYFLWHPV